MSIQEIDKQFVAGTYNRFPITLTCGQGSIVKDENGKEYIDMGSGIGVTAFGIADDEWTKAVTTQASTLQHVIKAPKKIPSPTPAIALITA